MYVYFVLVRGGVYEEEDFIIFGERNFSLCIF